MHIQKLTSFTMDSGEHKGLACTAPCSMFSVLLEHGLIEDPYYRDNEKKVRELSKNDCTFTAEFLVSEMTASRKNLLLRFHCLDTLCDIELNGKRIANTDNMHRTYTFDVKDILTAGKNTLKIHIRSATLEMDKRQSEHPLCYDLHCYPGHAHLRKAYYMSGWDWAPTLTDMGIMRDVELLAFDARMIDRVEIRQIHSENEVRLDLTLHTSGSDELCRAVATLVSPGGNVFYCGLISGKGSITVTNPNLWWPNGLGAQNLYKLTVNLYSDTEICDSKEMRIGLRTLTVTREPDEYGESFALTVNGLPFFSRGANYVPEDSIIPWTSRERTKRLLEDARAANFNTVRVWGGAYYPTDYFYDLCDELGLVVWQDYMVACANILMTDEYRENFKEEFIDNFTRLGHHASLGIVSGNNEMEQFVDEGTAFDSSEQTRRDYLALYEELLPSLMKEYLPDTFYWPSSPSSGGGFVSPNDENRGDCHFWKVWGGGEPYEICRNYYFRYLSEFGFESLPCEKTVRAFAEEDDLNIFSPVMEWHQKKKMCGNGNRLMIKYAAELHRYPYSFGSFAYMTQLVQAEAIRSTVEHMRRNRGRCMGSIYWQFNDCWPVASWSSIDYFGRWKALHYYAKRFYAPVLISVSDDGPRVTFNLANEQRIVFDGSFSYSVVDNRDRTVFKDSFPISVEPMSAANILTTDLTSLISGHENEYVLVYSVSDGLSAKSQGTYSFVKPKDFNFIKPNIESEISGTGKDFCITLTSDVYAACVELDFTELDAVFDDNYFDLIGGVPARVHFKTREVTNLDALRRQLHIRSVYDIGREK